MPDLPNDPAQHTMSFGDHLEELRRRIMLALAAPLPLFIVIFFFSDTLVEWLLLPVYDVLRQHDLPADMQVLSPQEFLLLELKLSAIAAVVISVPWILWQAWRFVAPGLYVQERRFVHLLIPGSAILTVAGVVLLYFVMLPLMLHVLVMFAANVRIDSGLPEAQVRAYLDAAGPVPILTVPPAAPAAGDVWLLAPELELYVAMPGPDGPGTDGAGTDGPGTDGVVRPELVPRSGGRIEQSFRVASVVNFVLVLLLGIVAAFQMPLVIVLLGWINLVSVAWLRARRRYALAICGVLSAVLTPADAVSMLIMLAPLYGLYELGIVLLWLLPASAVAEGRLGGRGRRRTKEADKMRSGKTAPAAAGPSQSIDPAQPEATVPRTDAPTESRADATEGKEDEG